MKERKRRWLWLLAAAMLVGATSSGWAVSLPFEDGFENTAVGAYPAPDGWIALLIGKSGYVSNGVAHTGGQSFRLDSWPWLARTDYVRLDQVPDCVGYQASVYLDAAKGRAGAVGFVNRFGSAPMVNYFLVDGRSRRVMFYGASWVDLGPYTPGTWCSVHADLDYPELKADLWVNGVLMAEQVGIAPREFYTSSTTSVLLNQWGVNAPSTSFSDSYWGNLVYFDDLELWEWSKVITVVVDIKPGSDTNPINLRSRGVLPVAIFSSEDFDATQVDPSTVDVAGAGVAVRGRGRYMAHPEDVDGDGLVDLVIQVEVQDLDPSQLQDGYAVVTGATYDDEEFQGEDAVLLVPGRG